VVVRLGLFGAAKSSVRTGQGYFFIDPHGHLEGYGCEASGQGSFGLIHPERFTVEQRQTKLTEMAQQMGVAPTAFVSSYEYSGELRLAEDIWQGRIHWIGDAARTTDPASSSGLNMSIQANSIHPRREHGIFTL
jgi:hypothetical protein